MSDANNSKKSSGLKGDWQVIRSLLPYLARYRMRITAAFLFLILAKLANIGVPLALKGIVDSLDVDSSEPAGLVVLPVSLLLAYGLLRLFTSLFNELRNAIFARASQRSTRKISLQVFSYLHQLSLRFHLDRQTGALSRDMERGSRSISLLLQYVVFNILPTVFEMLVVCAILYWHFGASFAVVIVLTIAIYWIYTYRVNAWRMKIRQQMNESDSNANSVALDALINYETVKYFNNEEHESQRYNHRLENWENASVRVQTSLATLNTGQGLIISVGLTVIMFMTANGVVRGELTLGDFVLVNAFLIQLYIPLSFLGTIFREIQHCLTDMERMFSLMEVNREIQDAPDAEPLVVSTGRIEFDNVSFRYTDDRQILKGVSFIVEPGTKLAVVGPSGSGKSTITRLLFRFFDVSDGCIKIDGHDIRGVTLTSLRSAIGVVPQDTVLFNDDIGYNIRYGRPTATDGEVIAAARMASLDSFISRLPNGLNTMVGERGLKLSGGEKQRVAIARTLLKNPPVLILDEATSALDSNSEQAIQGALVQISRNRTTVVVAHRLSTVIDADIILVLDQGQIAERGSHEALLKLDGQYAEMWRLQQDESRH